MFVLPSSVQACIGPSPRPGASSLLLCASSSSSGSSSWCRRPCSCSSKPQWQQHHGSSTHTAAGAVPHRHQHQQQLVPPLRRPRHAAVCAAAPAAAAAAPSAAAAASTAAADGWRALLLDKALGTPGQLVKLQLKGRIQGDPQLAVVRPAAGSSSSSGAADGVPAAGAAGAAQPSSMPYRQLTLRPVLLRGKMMMQLSVFTERQDITKNYTPQQAQQELSRLLQLPWSNAALVTLQESVTVTISRKGKAQVTCKQAPASSSSSGTASAAAASASDTPAPQPAAVDLPDGFLAPPGSSSSSSPIQQQQQQQLISLQHDRPKAQPIDGSTPHPFLQQIGLQTADGRIKASMQGKFTQINEFLRLLSHSGSLDKFKGRAKSKPGAAAAAAAASLDSQDSGPEDSSSSSSSSIERPVHVLDAGCGSSHLTLGTFHYLSSVLALPVRLSGVDTNAALMARSNRTCAELGIERVAQFHAAAIRDVPALGLPPPDLLLALHACDTATDEALALGVSGRARLIMCVPCCHKDLHQQFAQQQRQQQQQQQQQQGGRSSGGGRGRGRSGDQAAVTGLFAPLLGHGILKQRQLDLLTDSLRAALLRLAGYRTDVVEFVSTEHTPRNLLIRAVRATQPLTASDTARLARGYVQLRDAWGVAPRLEALLRQDGSLSEAVLRELGG